MPSLPLRQRREEIMALNIKREQSIAAMKTKISSLMLMSGIKFEWHTFFVDPRLFFIEGTYLMLNKY